MDDRVVLKIYYYGKILLQTYEGVQFVCENPLDVVIPFTLSFEEFKGVICEKIDSQRCRRVSCILYRYHLPVFGGFVQFQTKYVTDEASMHEMFSMYMENCHRMSCIELYIEFEQSEADRNIELEDYNSESEDEFESNYEIVGPGEDEDEAGGAMNADVAEVANALANAHPFQEPSFMRSLDLEAMHAPEFPQYMNAVVLYVDGIAKNKTITILHSKVILTEYIMKHLLLLMYATPPVVADGEFTVGMEFSSREAVIKAMKDYTIRRGVDYRVYESELMIFYAKCTEYGNGCDWLIRKKYCWEIRRYNGSHTCTRSTISQDHSKMDSKTVVEAIKPLVEVDPSIKVKSVIADVQSNRRSNQFSEVGKHRMKLCPYGYSRTTREYQMRYERLKERGEAYTNWLDRIPREQYALAFDGGYRWDHMTTNLVECINFVLQGARNLPVTAKYGVRNIWCKILNPLLGRFRWRWWWWRTFWILFKYKIIQQPPVVRKRFISSQLCHLPTDNPLVNLSYPKQNTISINYFNAYFNQNYLFAIGNTRGLPGIGARNGSRIQAQATNSVSGPSISLQSTRVALHNDLYKCARHAEPQLNCMIPPKFRSKVRLPRCNSKLVQALGFQCLKATHGRTCNQKTICRQTENYRYILQGHGTLTNQKMKSVSLEPPSLNQSINHC
ncbi:hypothetical protein Ahy_B05g075684 [Arachis hypogaea]|uniref:Transposase MuDR plant domain-containing protein n=1 Tax=Arachis hypogaea TaxID=3818 RepID=A0A444Z1R6_ARAHY|nr:hypothetical protein Ahy_B05g075684 [Arachis hypogaea]